MHGRAFHATLLLAVLGTTGCLQPRSPAVAIWAVSGDEELTHDTPPSPENDAYSSSRGELRLTAALNETVAFQLALRTGTPPAGPFQVELSDFEGPGGLLPAAMVVTLYRVQYTRIEQFRSWYPGHATRPATPTLFPDVLVPWSAPRGGGPMLLSESRNEIVWGDVHVPPTIAPGEYGGRLLVRSAANQAPVFACAVRLEVLPVALPGPRSLPVVCRVDPRDLLVAHLRWPRAPAEHTRLLPGVPSHLAPVRLANETMRRLQEHRTTPVLWASFPKLRPLGDRQVEVEWSEYDRLVAPWLDGSAFDDQVGLQVWPIPASLDYPAADKSGGLEAPQYAGLLTAYLAECQRHFAERGWLERAIVRLCPPEPLSRAAVDRVRRAAAITRQSNTGLRIMAHLPARSLRGLGWHNAPTVELPDVGAWAPPAMWFEPSALAQEQALGRQAWLVPDQPPYSGSLAVEAPLTDTWTLPWLAYRYGIDGLWIEDAANLAESRTAEPHQPQAGAGLLYAGETYGLHDTPVVSARLKRLRRGLQDYELLKLLEANGQQLLARRVAEQVVRWAGTDAGLENLLSTKEPGWPTRPEILRLARTLMLRELAGEFVRDATARQQQVASLAEWALMFNQADRVTATVDSVRLVPAPAGLRARVGVSVSNATDRPVEGRWRLPNPPPGWHVPPAVPSATPAGGRRTAEIELDLAGLAYNVDGVYPFDVVFETNGLGTFVRPARLAVAACPRIETPPRIDGRLDDWPLASNNAAGDFRLCRGPAAGPAQPTLHTQAFFCLCDERLYVAVRCALRAGEPPVWEADNIIPVDGASPWGQDVVEVLIDPRSTAEGTSSDVYCLQVKPSGLLLARRGGRTDPPIGGSEDWPCGARAAVQIERETWIVELAVPLEALGPAARTSAVWGFNVTRLDARRGEYSSWSGARGHCYAPRSLGNLIMLAR